MVRNGPLSFILVVWSIGLANGRDMGEARKKRGVKDFWTHQLVQKDIFVYCWVSRH